MVRIILKPRACFNKCRHPHLSHKKRADKIGKASQQVWIKLCPSVIPSPCFFPNGFLSRNGRVMAKRPEASDLEKGRRNHYLKHSECSNAYLISNHLQSVERQRERERMETPMMREEQCTAAKFINHPVSMASTKMSLLFSAHINCSPREAKNGLDRRRLHRYYGITC